ncbi:IPT/TIG domain-containing protein [Chitinimonas sp. BJB300]|uniref:IPT/TIG domain-containing protein n=1 Tax=Chitinimonas sp. BJB300 TaxID=1559339 RepID=UPI000C0CBCC6|nr:IPT/TIG domain-containing protein [Chitinimonas sp. BJB300]PHV12404.1 hypothetical protein CSQ89_05810 [Chitinimonas sp. BJB300]TSJ89000.1 hypothetical protein FG002_008930 [Chitinimonas sp. BJB300]
MSTIAPLQAAVGDRITIEGSGLQAVSRALLGGVEVKFSVVSNTQLTIEVPENVQSGAVQLQASGTIVQSLQQVLVTGVPTFTRLEPSTAKAGVPITIHGDSLDRVKEVRLNGKPVAVLRSESNEKQIVFHVADTDRSGMLTLHYGTGAVLTVTVPLTVDVLSTVTGIRPVEGLTGSSVEIEGTNLDEIKEVVFSTGSTSSAVSPEKISATRLRVIVPADATTGRIKLTRANNSKQLVAGTFTVTPQIAVKDMQPQATETGHPIVVTGSNLDEWQAQCSDKSSLIIGLQMAGL